VLASGVNVGYVDFLAVDSTYLYWTAAASIMRIPLTGGAPTTIATGPPDAEGVAVDATYVYWTTYEGGTILRAPLTGGSATTMLSGMGFTPFGIAVDAGAIYFTSLSTGTVNVMPLDGGTPSALTTGLPAQSGATGIAVNGSSVYWGRAYEALDEIPLGGGTTMTIAGAQADPFGVAVDDSYVYWTALYGGALMKAPLGGGTVTTLVSHLTAYAGGVAVDSKAIYWAVADAQDVGSIMRLAK
jgi:hypothetical protein